MTTESSPTPQQLQVIDAVHQAVQLHQEELSASASGTVSGQKKTVAGVNARGTDTQSSASLSKFTPKTLHSWLHHTIEFRQMPDGQELLTLNPTPQLAMLLGGACLLAIVAAVSFKTFAKLTHPKKKNQIKRIEL